MFRRSHARPQRPSPRPVAEEGESPRAEQLPGLASFRFRIGYSIGHERGRQTYRHGDKLLTHFQHYVVLVNTPENNTVDIMRKLRLQRVESEHCCSAPWARAHVVVRFDIPRVTNVEGHNIGGTLGLGRHRLRSCGGYNASEFVFSFQKSSATFNVLCSMAYSQLTQKHKRKEDSDSIPIIREVQMQLQHRHRHRRRQPPQDSFSPGHRYYRRRRTTTGCP